jgi:hypothetical protein
LLVVYNERWLELALFADRRNNQPGGNRSAAVIISIGRSS